MKKIIKLTESDLARIVKRVIRENKNQSNGYYGGSRGIYPSRGRYMMEDNSAKPVADFNEGVIITNQEDNFGPQSLAQKTINLYDDSGKQVWDQTWYITNFTKENYDKKLVFSLNKDLKKDGNPATAEVGTMVFDCNKPDSFVVSYDFKGAQGQTNVSNEMRYNPDVTTRLKTEYCPGVLGVKAQSADFASTGSKPQSDFA
jgi:hypothetical protein